jgi:hypothetical protein
MLSAAKKPSYSIATFIVCHLDDNKVQCIQFRVAALGSQPKQKRSAINFVSSRAKRRVSGNNQGRDQLRAEAIPELNGKERAQEQIVNHEKAASTNDVRARGQKRKGRIVADAALSFPMSTF